MKNIAAGTFEYFIKRVLIKSWNNEVNVFPSYLFLFTECRKTAAVSAAFVRSCGTGTGNVVTLHKFNHILITFFFFAVDCIERMLDKYWIINTASSQKNIVTYKGFA
jgi:hypothetical protein